MSLKVWLPFTDGIYNNKGSGNYNITPINSPVLDRNGKLGKCLGRVGNSTGVSINSNLINDLGNEYSFAIWVCPLGNHVHYNGTFISSGDWNKSCWAFGVNQNNTSVDVAGPGYNKYISCSVPVNTWTHLVCTIKNSVSTLYKNGVYVGEKSLSNNGVLRSDTNWTCIQRETYAGGYFSFNGKINDLRIYNHCLSIAEIKELSRGLVARYTFNNPNLEQTINLCPKITYDEKNKGSWGWTTSEAHHIDISNEPVPSSIGTKLITTYDSSQPWGGTSVYAGSCKIKPNTKYFYSTYIKATDNFSYIHPNFLYSYQYNSSGGYITEFGLANSSNRIYIGNGWYRFFGSFISNSAAASINLYFFSYPTHNVDYILAAPQFEENDHFTPYVFGSRTPTVIPDNSGNGYDGIIYGNLKSISDSPRNSSCCYMGAYRNPYIDISKVVDNSSLSDCTVTFWAKYDDGVTLLFTGQTTSYYLMATNNNNFYHSNFGSVSVYRDGIKGSYSTDKGKWHFYAVKNVNMSGITKLYLNNYSEHWKFGGNISDLRIYSTPLSDEDIMKLYNSPIKISNKNTLMIDGEFIENGLDNIASKVEQSRAQKKWSNGLSSYTQTHCQCTLTDEGYRIYRTPNQDYQNGNNSVMWGGFVLDNTNNHLGLIKGHSYVFMVDIKGKSSNGASEVYWSNLVGWGGGGLSPTPETISKTYPSDNFNSEEFKSFHYAFKIPDDIYKVCTTAYSGFIKGETYVSYKGLKLGFGYWNTGPIGTDIYIKNIRFYDITELSDKQVSKICKTGNIECTELNELRNICEVDKYGNLLSSEFIEK